MTERERAVERQCVGLVNRAKGWQADREGAMKDV